MPIKILARDLEWLRGQTTLNNETGCWEWRLTKERPPLLPYGRCYFGKKYRLAHRVAWEIVNGPVPVEMCILHRCDNPPCCNPIHLFLGTRTDNVIDRDAKGRMAKGERHGFKKHPEKWSRGNAHWTRLRPDAVLCGEKNGNAKLTKEKASAIISLYGLGIAVNQLASQFGVGCSTIYRVITGENWRQP